MATNSKPPEHTTVLSHVSSSYILFPELAEAIRDAPTDEAIEAFKGLAKIVVMAHQARRMKTGNIPNDIHVDCLFRKIEAEFRAFQRLTFWGTDDVGGHDDRESSNSGENSNEESSRNAANNRLRDDRTGSNRAGDSRARVRRLRPHLLSRLDAAKAFTFIYDNFERLVGDAEKVVLWQDGSEINEAEHWLVSCVQQAMDADATPRSKWWRYLEEQPEYEPAEDAEERYERNMRRFHEDGSSVSFPGLVQVLRSFVSLACFDAAGVSVVLREYISLGATAAGIWMHMWQSHGIQRGQPLADDDYHVQVALEKIEESFGDRISDWQDAAPLHVRHVLAEHCFEGDFLFLTNHVFPAVIAPSGSGIHEDSFAGEIHKFIVRAATSVHVDPQGRIRRLIQQCGWYPEETHPNGNHGQPQLARPFVSFRNINSQEQ